MFSQNAQFQPPAPGPTLITNFQQLRDHVLGFQANYNQYLLQFMQQVINTQNGLQDFSLQPLTTASGGTAETSLSFDGINGHVSAPQVTSATANVTLEMLVLLPVVPQGGFLYVGSGNGYGIGVGAQGTNFSAASPGPYLIGFEAGTGYLYPSGNPSLSIGTWHYVAMVIGAHATAPIFYIDANSHLGTAVATPTTPTGGVIFGSAGSGFGFNGSLARVAIYTAALTPTQIAAHYAAFGNDANYDAAVLADTPVAFWKLTDVAGPTVVDSSGNGNDGTAIGGVSFQQNTPFGDAITPTNYMHVVAGNSTINTINPATGFSGQVALIAQDGFSLGTSGNIAQPKTVQPGQVVTLQYHPVEEMWYPSTTITNLQDVPDNPATGTFSTGYGVTTGSNNFSGTLGPPAPPNQAALRGKTLAVVFPNGNTGACTLNFNAFGAQPIVKNHSQPLIAGDIRASQLSHVLWNGTAYELQAPNGPTHRDMNGGTTSGTGLYTATVGWNPTSNADLTNLPVAVKFGSSNSGSGPQLSVNSLAAATIVGADGATIATGAIQAGATTTAVYDGTNYRIQSGYTIPVASTALTAGTNITITGNTIAASGGAAYTAGTGIDVTGTVISTDLSAGTGIALSGTHPQAIATDLAAGTGISLSGTHPRTITNTVAGISAASLGSPGYVQFSNGLLIQWGTRAFSTIAPQSWAQFTVTYPIAFSSQAFVGFVTGTGAATTAGAFVGEIAGVSVNQGSVQVFNASTVNTISDTVAWMVIGV